MLWWDKRKLRSDAAATRREAAAKLAAYGPAAVDALLEATRDSDADVGRAAIGSLGAIGDRRAVPRLIEALADLRLESAAAVALGRIGDRAAIAPLVAAATRRSAREVLDALDRIDGAWRAGPEARAAVARLVEERPLSLDALDRIAPGWQKAGLARPAVPALLERARQCDPDALEALDRIDPAWRSGPVRAEVIETSLARLANVNSDDDPIGRERAAVCMGVLREPRAVSPLIACLKDGYVSVKREAGRALDRIDRDWRSSEAARPAMAKPPPRPEPPPPSPASVACSGCGRALDPSRVEGGDRPNVALVVAGQLLPLRCASCGRVVCHECQPGDGQGVSLTCAACGGRLEVMTRPGGTVDPSACLASSIRLAQDGDLRGAIQAATRAIQADASSCDAYYVRGKLRVALGDRHGMVDDFRKALQHAPDGWEHRDEAELYVNPRRR